MTKMQQIDIMNPPDWDALWSDAEIPGGRNGAWRDVLAYRTKLPDDAIRLAGHGWSPELVVAARDNPNLYYDSEDLPVVDESYPDEAVPAGIAAKLVLADETAKWHESRMQLARELRWKHMRRLAARTDLGWSHQMIGDLIGLTRQRVRAILRSNLTRIWADE
ncbi:hypothetical protein [Microbacterium karelineae]|uniref:hypothetical protein n=1 Tax=Microbacterium karelineae TaxID=2654283 RepID=UPI0012EAE09D|nr:hypothetical protein [Microbacterium karelineae]